MGEIDAETVERVVRWCAEAGRQTTPRTTRAALAPLTWDELLAVRALLADPPPGRPLGPHALADLARGVPADLAAERERAGRYPAEREAGDAPAPTTPAPSAPDPGARRPAGAQRRGPAPVVVRRARDRAPAPTPVTPALPLLDELWLPDGRAVLDRLVRRHGARRAAIAAELAARWRAPDGAAPGPETLARLLDHHGLARAFERRERDELLHALRAAGGVRLRAAARVGLDPAGLDAALARLGAGAEAERIRGRRRGELRGRATLTERAHLLLEDPARLEDLDLLREVEQDLKARLPDHLRALRSSGGDLRAALARSLSLPLAAADALLSRLGLPPPPAEPARRPPPRRSPGPGRGASGPRRPRTAAAGARGPRRPRPGTSGAPGPRRPRPAAAGAPRPAGEGRRPRSGSSRERGPRRPTRGPAR